MTTSPTRSAGAWACAAALAVMLAPGAAVAQTAQEKFGRGLAAMTTGFLEVPGHMVEESRRNGPAAGATLGFAKGLGAVVVRELVGVYEFVTAPFPVPRGYRPVIEPEYPWDHFEPEEG